MLRRAARDLGTPVRIDTGRARARLNQAAPATSCCSAANSWGRLLATLWFVAISKWITRQGDVEVVHRSAPGADLGLQLKTGLLSLFVAENLL